MKNIFYIALFVFLSGNIYIIGAQNNQSGNSGIKTIDPVEMVSTPKNEEAYEAYGIGTRLMYENRLAEAEYYLKEAIELEPDFVDALDHLGIVYRRLNRLEEAEAAYLRSIEINNQNRVPFINLAVVYRLQNRLNEAFELYRRIIEINQNEPEGYYGIGELYYIVGNYEYAMMFFDVAEELYINLNSSLFYDVCYYKGMINFEYGEYETALFYLEEARKGNPNNTEIERTINTIKNLLLQ